MRDSLLEWSAGRAKADLLPDAHRLHLPSDDLTIWYAVTEGPDGQAVIVVQDVKADK